MSPEPKNASRLLKSVDSQKISPLKLKVSKLQILMNKNSNKMKRKTLIRRIACLKTLR